MDERERKKESEKADAEKVIKAFAGCENNILKRISRESFKKIKNVMIRYNVQFTLLKIFFCWLIIALDAKYNIVFTTVINHIII